VSYRKYTKYKPSGIEWIGEIPKHWEVKRLKFFLGSEQNGIWGGEAKGDKNDIICIRVADFDREFNNLNATEFTIRNIKPQDFNKRKLQYGDLLIEKSGGGELTPIGRVGFFDLKNIKAVCSNFMVRIRIKNIYDSRFFFYLFRAMYKNKINLKSIKQTTGIQNLDTYSYFCEIVATPTKNSEQTAIASFLDQKTAKIDSLIEKKKRLIELYKEERASVINYAVTRGLAPNVKLKDSGVEWLDKIPEHWEVSKLKYLLIPKKGALKPGPFGSDLKNSDVSSKGIYKVYTQQNVIENNFEIGEDFITDKKFAELEAFEIFPGDILMTSRGTIGCAALFSSGLFKGILHPCLIRLQFDETKVLRKWMLIYFNDSSFFIENVKLNSNSTVIDVIYGYTLKEIIIPIPPIYEQLQIIKHIETETKRIDAKIAKTEKQIELLKEYRASLISEVVTGKIKVI
jgi:type I restriction enzyme S subunit